MKNKRLKDCLKNVFNRDKPKEKIYRWIDNGVATNLGLYNKKIITEKDLKGCVHLSCYSNFQNLQEIRIPNTVKSIKRDCFSNSHKLKSISIPNTVKYIQKGTFYRCGFDVKEKYDKHDRLIAYKGFYKNMTCHGNYMDKPFQYKEGKTYRLPFFSRARLCRRGFHACINPLDCLNYYWGKIEEETVFHEVYLEGVSKERDGDSKVVARKITIGRELTLPEMADIASGRK